MLVSIKASAIPIDSDLLEGSYREGATSNNLRTLPACLCLPCLASQLLYSWYVETQTCQICHDLSTYQVYLMILYVIWCYAYTYPYSRTVGGQTCFIWPGAVFLAACTILEFGAKNSDLNATCSILEHVESICTILEREEEKNGRASWACGLLFHVFCFLAFLISPLFSSCDLVGLVVFMLRLFGFLLFSLLLLNCCPFRQARRRRATKASNCQHPTTNDQKNNENKKGRATTLGFSGVEGAAPRHHVMTSTVPQQQHQTLTAQAGAPATTATQNEKVEQQPKTTTMIITRRRRRCNKFKNNGHWIPKCYRFQSRDKV